MIRFLICVAVLVLFLILTIPALFVEWLIGKKRPDVKDRSSLAIVKLGFRLLAFLSGATVVALGEGRIPQDTAVLYVGNHQSFFDIILTYIRVPRPTGYVAKKEMLKAPLLRSWMKNVHCLFLDRQDVRQGLRTILAAVNEVQAGISICIFPEGTRNETPDTFLPFHQGSFKIAEKGKVPIIPMTIVNSAAVFEEHFPKIRRATVIIEYGEPVYPERLSKEDRKDLGNHIRKIMEETYARNKRQYLGE
ncbi:MAG: 1-acyl-sn-glycerol-3-phosphate acyltransferase [Clostridium sp.]|nr:1-acyl-sn-glycerol-3-phosphate acyltransferase [Clostridium sp.]